MTDQTSGVAEAIDAAVLRRAARAYLRRSRAQRIAEAYRKAYGDGGGLGDEWAGWVDEGAWPAR